MLKIKDDVDLNILEKFGFKKQDCLNEYGTLVKCDCNVWRKGDMKTFMSYDYGITIFEHTPTSEYFANDDFLEYEDKTRIIYIMADDSSYMEACSFEISNTIYDLIQAGLVEKI